MCRNLAMQRRQRNRSGGVSWLALVILLSASSAAAADAPRVVLNVSKAGPRAVEPLTERSLLRDYKFAWSNLALALESNSEGPLNGLFIGSASRWLHQAVKDQQKNGLTSRYLHPSHKVEAVFYAPEGDVIELHDVAEFDYQILDSGKAIHNEHAIVHYVVLMTPGADRWVVRQLQSVQQF
jgi:hypothetical protein